MEELTDMEEFMKDFTENVRTDVDLKFPLEVSEIKMNGARSGTSRIVGSWVSIRPCDGDKTYLGVYLGDMTLSSFCSYHLKTKVLSITPHTNPAIYVPDLKRVVWGMESWWGTISKPEDLKKITNADIQNVWCVKALIELGEASIAEEEG